MEWLSQNWVWVLFAVGMVAMHMFGHGGHGGHAGHDRHGGGSNSGRDAPQSGEQRQCSTHFGTRAWQSSPTLKFWTFELEQQC